MKTRAAGAGLLLAAAFALGACSQAPSTPTADRPDQPAPSLSDPGAAVPTTAQPGSAEPPSTPAPATSTNAQTKGGPLTVYASADDRAKVVTTLKPTTTFGSKTTLLVTQQKEGWVQVELPTRPNGSSGWVKQDQVNLRQNDVTIYVDLASRAARVTKGDEVVAETAVAVGSKENPTPKGTFYVTDLVQNRNPKDAYGPFALGLSAHSETLSEFGGGDGQVAIHGTNEPTSIGKAVSHGCVRLPNEVIQVLGEAAPLGTPVVIV